MHKVTKIFIKMPPRKSNKNVRHAALLKVLQLQKAKKPVTREGGSDESSSSKEEMVVAPSQVSKPSSRNPTARKAPVKKIMTPRESSSSEGEAEGGVDVPSSRANVTAELPQESPMSDVQQSPSIISDIREAVDKATSQTQGEPEEGSQLPSSKRQKKTTVADHLTDEEEAGIVEWYQANPCLYDQQTRDYMNKSKKDALYEAKAKDLGITASELLSYVKSMRTQYRKFTLSKSGQATRKPTDRQSWILRNYSFLEGFHRPRTGGKTLGIVSIHNVLSL